MDIVVPATYFENLKRYWRTRGYQRLDDGKKRLKNTRLGVSKTRRVWKIRRAVRKLRFKIVPPIKLLAKFHDAYVDMMIRLVGDNNVGLFGAKMIPKARPAVPMGCANDHHTVDGKLVFGDLQVVDVFS